ncbi:MAG: uracil-DNA glycosylase family protein [Candidatus Puniceispirillales bacterium]
MEKNNNELYLLIAKLDWQLNMGVEAMVEEKHNNYSNIGNVKTNDEGFLKLDTTQKIENSYLQEKKANQNNTLQQGIDKCLTLEDLKNYMLDFNGCDLKKTATQMVFSDGNPKSKVMIIGEAPGAEEDRQGKPFCGVSGTLLDKMLASINLDRTSVYITNVIPWRPPGNRTPTENEINLMKPFLMRHIEIVTPKILVAVGGSASKAILDIEGGILRHRGVWKEIRFSNLLAIPIIATLHPAYLLRAPNQKKLAWEDLKSIRSKLEQLND